MADEKKRGFWKRLMNFLGSAMSHDRTAQAGHRHNNAVLGAEANRYTGHH